MHWWLVVARASLVTGARILGWLWPEAFAGRNRGASGEWLTASACDGKLPVGAIDTRASGWWAMIFVVFTEASLFAYLLFSYYYLAVQPHLPGTFPEGGAPIADAGAAQHVDPAAVERRGGLGAVRHRA